MKVKQLAMLALFAGVAVNAHAANRPAGYTTICTEGKTCSVAANTNVAYGRSDQFTYKVWAEPGTLHQPSPGPQGRGGSPHPTGQPDGFQAPFVLPTLVTLQNLPFSRNDPWLAPGSTETNGNNAIVALPPLAAAHFWMTPAGWRLYLAAFIAALALFGLATNQCHKWAHSWRVPRLVSLLQRAGLSVDQAEHVETKGLL